MTPESVLLVGVFALIIVGGAAWIGFIIGNRREFEKEMAAYVRGANDARGSALRCPTCGEAQPILRHHHNRPEAKA